MAPQHHAYREIAKAGDRAAKAMESAGFVPEYDYSASLLMFFLKDKASLNALREYFFNIYKTSYMASQSNRHRRVRDNNDKFTPNEFKDLAADVRAPYTRFHDVWCTNPFVVIREVGWDTHDYDYWLLVKLGKNFLNGPPLARLQIGLARAMTRLPGSLSPAQFDVDQELLEALVAFVEFVKGELTPTNWQDSFLVDLLGLRPASSETAER